MKPVIDQIFELILQGRMDEIDNISTPSDAVHIRTVVSTKNKGGTNLEVDLDEIKKVAPWITPFFLGPRLVFSSKSIAVQNALTGGRSNFLIDWSFSFDSNVAEKVRAYVNGENINNKDRNRVITLLRLKKKYSLQTDLLPFLLENLRLSRNDERNERPLNTIVSFKKLDYIDWEMFEENPNKPCFKCLETDLIKDANDTYESLINDTEVKKWEYKSLFTQVILFELAIVWLRKNASIEEQFRHLIEFCVLNLGKLAKFELKFAWRFLNEPTKIRFFGPLNGVKKDLVKALKGMAWDMTHLRLLETLSTKSELDSFYLPFFVSFDERFSEILKQNQVQILMIDDRLKRMHTATTDEYAFLHKLDSCMSEKTKNVMGQSHSDARRKYNVPENDLVQILKFQTVELEKLATIEREARRYNKKN